MSIADHPRRAARARRPTRRAIGWERILARLILEAGLPAPVIEHPFSKELGRKHRFDLAWKDRMLALEIEGGIWTRGGGRHNRGSGYLRDIEKYNLAAQLGWKVLRCTPQDINTGKALVLVRENLK